MINVGHDRQYNSSSSLKANDYNNETTKMGEFVAGDSILPIIHQPRPVTNLG